MLDISNNEALSNEPPDDEVLTPEEFERVYKITRGTQAVMRHRRQLPYYQLGGGRLIRYRRSECDAWFAARAVKP